jgi:N-acetylglucosamine-6-phosphate deacetylase
MLITDRVQLPETGADPQQTAFGATGIVDDGTALRLADGRLAGSSLSLDRALRNAIAFGALGRLEAIVALTLAPARLLGMENERGTLRPGARADLVVLDADNQVQETWIAGRQCYRAPKAPTAV